MFDSSLSYAQVKAKFRWQVCRRLEDFAPDSNSIVIIGFTRKYKAFFGKIIRVNGIRFLFLYFNRESDMRNTINESMDKENSRYRLIVKNQNEYIDDKGEIKSVVRQRRYYDDTSRSRRQMEREQSEIFADPSSSRPHCN